MPSTEPGRPKTTLRASSRLAGLVHRGEARRGLGAHRLGIVPGRPGPLEDVDVEGGEVGEVEAHAGAAVRDAPGEVGARPVEHRHEVVAQHRDPGVREVAQALAVGGEMLPPGALLLLDVLGDRQALDHLPGDAGGRAVLARRDLALAPRDLAGGPDGAGRDVVEGRDDAFDPGLEHVVDRDEILRPEPPPRLSHVPSSRCRRAFARLSRRLPPSGLVVQRQSR